LIAEQLPIDVGQAPQNGGRMRLLVKYVASVYVVPRNVKAVLSVADTQLVSEGDKRWLQIQLRNDGGTRKILKGAKLEVAGQTLAGEQLKGLEGENMLAGAQRTFRLPAPVGINAVSSPARLLIE
jgi:fimbrial chaperone protein